MTPEPLPLIQVAGTHREVGLQMGDAVRELIRASVGSMWDDLPGSRTRDDVLGLATEFRAFTEPRLPWLIEELDGCAEAAGVDPLAFFATTIEEIWYEPRTRVTQGRCSDVVAGPSATADGHLLVGHTNDLGAGAEAGIVALEKRVTGDPVVFQLGVIPVLSVAWNSAGLSLTGNELSPNDERVGISRDHQVLEMIRSRSLQEMVDAALRPDRASSYNNVLTSADGGVANVEGSATDAEISVLDDDDHLVHTNHYVCDRMRSYEGDPEYAHRSNVRYERARTLIAAQAPGSVTLDVLRTILSDHDTAPDSLCRHPAGASDTKTVFWCTADVTEGRIVYGRGNPCDSVAQEYRFEGYAGR